MPALIDFSDLDKWLDPKTPFEEAFNLLQTISGKLVWYPVSSRVGNVKYDSPDCIKQIEKENKVNISKYFVKLEKSDEEVKVENSLISQDNRKDSNNSSLPLLIQTPSLENVIKQEEFELQSKKRKLDDRANDLFHEEEFWTSALPELEDIEQKTASLRNSISPLSKIQKIE